MRLLSLKVGGSRCFRDPVLLDSFDPGINIIHGPNEVGKSTLILSMARAFFDRCNTKAKEIMEMKPWNTDLVPSIEVEFEHDGERYQLLKRFVTEPCTKLRAWNGHKYQLVADGDGAEEQIRQMFDATLPRMGASDVSHWGLANLLWTPQDEHRLALPSFRGTVERRFAQVLGSMTLDPVEEEMVKTLDSEEGQIFTPRNKTFKTGSRVADLQARRSELLGVLQKCNATIDNIARDAEREEILAIDVREAQQRLTKLEQEIEAAQKELDQYQQLQLKMAQAQSKFAEVDGRHTALLEKISAYKAQEDIIKACTCQLAELEDALGKQQRDMAALTGQEKALLAHLQEAKEQLKTARQERERNQTISQYQLLAANHKKLSKMQSELTQLEAELDELYDQRGPLLSPDMVEIEKAKSLGKKVFQLETEIKAAGMTFNLTAQTDLLGSFEGQQPEPFSLKSGESAQFTSGSNAHLTIPKVLSLKVSSGSTDVEGLETRLKTTRSQLSHILASYNVTSVSELEALYLQGEELDRKIASWEMRLDDKTGDFADSSAVGQEIQRITGQMESISTLLGMKHEQIIQIVCFPDMELKGSVDEVESETTKLSDRLDKVRIDISQQKSEIAGLESQKVQAIQKQRSAEDTRSKIIKGQDITAIETERESLTRDLVLAQSKLDMLKKELPSEVDNPQVILKQAKTAFKTCESELKSKSEELIRVRERLENAGGDDLYQRQNQVQEESALVDEEIERQVRRAKALRLLHVLAHGQKDAISQMLATPVEKRLNQLYSVVRGRDDLQLKMGADLSDLHMKIGQEEQLPTKLLSGGAREQLALMTRLAAGDLLSDTEPMMVVLDDSLVFTDSLRLQRIVAIIEQMAQKIQIIILTCHPERYYGLEAKRFDLLKITGESANQEI